MKKYLFILLAVVSCSKSETVDEDKPDQTPILGEEVEIMPEPIFICNRNSDQCTSCAAELTTTIKPDSMFYDYRIEIFDNTIYCQNKHLSNKYMKDGKTYQNVGKFYHSVPFEMDEGSNYLIGLGQETDYYEILDSTMCEVGGNSAYDKYEFEKSGEAISKITHYKAWYEGYTDDGEPITYDTPNWFIGEIIEVSYVGNSRTLSTYDSENKLIDILTNTYNQNGDLVYQEWIRPEDKTFHSFYNF